MEFEVVDSFECCLDKMTEVYKNFSNKGYYIDVEHVICLNEEFKDEGSSMVEDNYIHNIRCKVTIKNLKR